jgi:hypothetical protein
MLKEEKTTQIAARFIQKAGGAMPYLKLIRLMYLTDRFSYNRCGRSMTGDTPISMSYGPALAETCALITGVKHCDHWDAWIAPINNDKISMKIKVHPDQFDLFSKATTKIVNEVYVKYGHKSNWTVEEIFQEFPEWKGPNSDGISIPLSTMLETTKLKSKDIAFVLQRKIEEEALEVALCRALP